MAQGLEDCVHILLPLFRRAGDDDLAVQITKHIFYLNPTSIISRALWNAFLTKGYPYVFKTFLAEVKSVCDLPVSGVHIEGAT